MRSGWSSNNRPEDTNWEEHGAQGDLESGRRFKKVQTVPNQVMIDEADGNTTYIGDAKPGIATDQAFWRIKRVLVSGTVTTISFADGEDAFTKTWTQRATYTY